MNQSHDTNLKSVTVVVPAYQAADCVGECIESLLAQDYPGDLLEIIVVDNNSTDSTADVIGRYPVRYVLEESRGAAPARNAGIRAAANELIAFTDADCVAEPDWLRQLAKRFDEPGVGGCGGLLAPAPPRTLIEEYIIDKNILSQERALRHEDTSLPFLITANAMYRRRTLDDIGGFDEQLTINGEDADLAWRVHWAGHRIVYEPGAVVCHKHRATLGGLLRQIRSYGAGSAHLFWKHHKRLGFDDYLIPEPYLELAKSFFAMPVCLLIGRGRLRRLRPALDFLGALAFLSGKISMSLKLGIRFY